MPSVAPMLSPKEREMMKYSPPPFHPFVGGQLRYGKRGGHRNQMPHEDEDENAPQPHRPHGIAEAKKYNRSHDGGEGGDVNGRSSEFSRIVHCRFSGF